MSWKVIFNLFPCIACLAVSCGASVLETAELVDPCPSKKAACSKTCNNIVKTNTCTFTPSSGAVWSCLCGAAPAKPSKLVRSVQARDQCLEKKAECESSCRGHSVDKNECTFSPTSGSVWSCLCGAWILKAPRVAGAGLTNLDPGKQRLALSVTAQLSLQKLVESLNSAWDVTKEVTVSGWKLKVGDRLLHEGSLAAALSREDIVKLISKDTVTLVVVVSELKSSELTGRRRRQSGFKDGCPSRKASCDARCESSSMQVKFFGCRWASNLGTRYQCKCASSSTSTRSIESIKTTMSKHLRQMREAELHTEKTNTVTTARETSSIVAAGKQRVALSVTAQLSLQKLVESLNSAWEVTKDVTVSGWKLKVGDKLLHEGSLAAASSREDIAKLISKDTVSLVVAVNKLKSSELTGRRRRRSGFKDGCAARKASCYDRCKSGSMEVKFFGCRWASNLGTRYQCQCASRSTSTGSIQSIKSTLLRHLRQLREAELRAEKTDTVTTTTALCSSELAEMKKLLQTMSAELTEIKTSAAECCNAKA